MHDASEEDGSASDLIFARQVNISIKALISRVYMVRTNSVTVRNPWKT